MKFSDSEIMERYLRGKSTPEETDTVLKWLMLNLKTEEADADFREILEKAPEKKDEERKQRTFNRISSFITEERHRRRNKVFKALLTAAASISTAAAIALTGISVHQQRELEYVPAWQEISTAFGEKKMVKLPDNSVIWLHNDSRISYPDKFSAGRRQVFVSGEIYAEIKSDATHPFVVSGDKVNVIVKGTKFNYSHYTGQKNVKLSLLEGSVVMDYLGDEGRKSIDIRPGEMITVDIDSDIVTMQNFDVDRYENWKDKRVLYFNDQTLTEIAEALQREFGVKVVIESGTLAATKHYASFVNNESPLEILKTICSEPWMKVYQKDTVIYISTIK